MATALEYSLIFGVIAVAAVVTAHCTRKPEPTITVSSPKPRPSPILIPLEINAYSSTTNSVMVDRQTGCQYLSSGYTFTPRYAEDGKTIMGCKLKDSSPNPKKK